MGAALGFCFVSALAIVQACMVANGIAEARRLNSNVRNACFRGTQAKFRDVRDLAEMLKPGPSSTFI